MSSHDRSSLMFRTSRVAAFVLVSVGFAAMGGGCTIIGAAAAKLAPDPTIPAQYVPDKVPTLLLVENFHNPASLLTASDSVLHEVMEDLKANNVAPLIDPQDAADLRHKNVTEYRKMPLDAIGRAVGAKQVIYVDLEQFEVSHALASDLFGGTALAHVRVVSAENGEVLWPGDSAGGYPVSVKVQPQRTAQGVGEESVRQQLSTALAEKVGKLFHSWTGSSSDGAAEQFQQQ